MKILAWLGLLVGIIAWGLAGFMGSNLLSGPMDARICKTDCVQTYFFLSVALALVALILGAVSLSNAGNKLISILSALSGLGLIGIYGFLFVAGNFF